MLNTFLFFFVMFSLSIYLKEGYLFAAIVVGAAFAAFSTLCWAIYAKLKGIDLQKNGPFS